MTVSVELIPITADELIEGFLAGESNFSGRIGRNLNLSGHKKFPELLRYFSCHKPSKKPIIRDSDFRGLIAKGMEVPYLSGNDPVRADFRETDFRETDFRNSILRRVDFRGANLRGANLGWADLSMADFTGADLSGADFSRTKLYETKFQGANLIEAKNLKYALDLERAEFGEDQNHRRTQVIPTDYRIISDAFTNDLFTIFS